MPRKAIPLDENTRAQIDRFFGDLGKAVVEGPPIACTLIATSVVENALMTLLVTFFVKGKTTDSLFGSRGVLGDLFKCTQIAYCIGLIPKSLKQNLETVAEIRNMFAHSTALIDFEDATIITLCSKLTLPNKRNTTTLAHNAQYPLARMQFTSVCGFLCQHLLTYAALYADKLAVYRGQLPRPAAAEW